MASSGLFLQPHRLAGLASAAPGKTQLHSDVPHRDAEPRNGSLLNGRTLWNGWVSPSESAAPPVPQSFESDSKEITLDDLDVKRLIGGIYEDVSEEKKKPVLYVPEIEVKRHTALLIQNPPVSQNRDLVPSYEQPPRVFTQNSPVRIPARPERRNSVPSTTQLSRTSIPRSSSERFRPQQSRVRSPRPIAKRQNSPAQLQKPKSKEVVASRYQKRDEFKAVSETVFSVLALEDSVESGEEEEELEEEEEQQFQQAPKSEVAVAEAVENVKPRFSNQKLWSLSKKDERKGIVQFWKGLTEAERKRITRVERNVILDWIKQVGTRKTHCYCKPCLRKRRLIEEDVDKLFKVFYENLECLDDHSIIKGDFDDRLMQNSFVGISKNFSGTDGNGLPDIFAFGCLMQIEDVVAHREIRFFIELLDRRAELKLQDETDRETSSAASQGSGTYKNNATTYECSHHCCDHYRYDDADCHCDDYYDYEDDVDDRSQCSEWDDLDLDDEKVSDIACRTLELFALKFFEKKLLGSYHERMSIRKQLALLEEEAMEKASQERKRAKRAEKKRKQRQKVKEKKKNSSSESQ